MNKRTVFYIVGANLLLILLLSLFLPHLMVAPGKLMEAHRALETDCFACHSPFRGSRPERCIQCHKPAEIGLVTTKGVAIGNEQKLIPFHQDLVEEECVACHSDHKGVQAFHPIGHFSHALLQPGIGERCDGCHRGPQDALHRQISGGCGQCHSQKGWTPATFDHDQFFLLDRDHQTTCNACHLDNDYSRYTCYGCHEHSRSGIRETHLEEGIDRYENCVECHRSGEAEGDEHEGRGWSRGELKSRPGGFDLRGTGAHGDSNGEDD
jgi:hypothetical protein